MGEKQFERKQWIVLNAWVTDNTHSSFRGKVEGVLSILPLAAMLIVAGGFGMIVEMIGYSMMFLCLGIIIFICGVCGGSSS